LFVLKNTIQLKSVTLSYKGSGDLTWIHGTDKEGYGFSVEDDGPCYDNYKLPPNKIKKVYKFIFLL
jgi:hypothetical protein